MNECADIHHPAPDPARPGPDPHAGFGPRKARPRADPDGFGPDFACEYERDAAEQKRCRDAEQRYKDYKDW